MNPIKLRSLLKHQETIPFFRKINLWDFIDDVAIGMDLQMSAGFELSNLPDILLKSEGNLENHLSLVKKFLHVLPENVTLQFVIQARLGDALRIQEFLKIVQSNPSLDELGQTIIKAKSNFLTEKFIQKRRSFLFLTSRPASRKDIPTISLSSIFEKPSDSLTRDVHQERLRSLEALAQNVVDSLRSLQIDSQRLNNEDLRQYFFSHLNPETSKAISPSNSRRSVFPHTFVTPRSLLTLNASENAYDHFLIDHYFHKTINLLVLPEEIRPSDLTSMMMDLWPDYDLGLTVHIADSERLIEKLKKDGNISRALSFSNFGSRYEAEQKFSELDDLIREIRSTSQKLFCFFILPPFKK